MRLGVPTASAGYLIDKAGLKGLRVGGAVVSDVHANFIVNDGTATSADVNQLVGEIKQKIKEKFGVDLVEEVFKVGENT
jgi:UDP-N-acetylmuramate dehydrogenase